MFGGAGFLPSTVCSGIVLQSFKSWFSARSSRGISSSSSTCPLAHLVQEAAVLTEMIESLDAYCQEYNTEGEIGWYAFLCNGKMSFTEFSRSVPILLGFVGRLSKISGSTADQTWKGFGQIEENVFQVLYYVHKKSSSDPTSLQTLLGEEGASYAIDELVT